MRSACRDFLVCRVVHPIRESFALHHVCPRCFKLTSLLMISTSNPPASGECTYGAPSVSAWAAVAVAVSSPKLRT